VLEQKLKGFHCVRLENIDFSAFAGTPKKNFLFGVAFHLASVSECSFSKNRRTEVGKEFE
jgi:hypothetical protein